jgi:hypothetical protein
MGGDELGGFLDREQLLGGSPARRAATLLYLIEARTARLAVQGRQRLVRPLTTESAQERALEFVEAFSLAGEAAVQPSVHDLERQADQWASLVPSNPRLRAALARRLGEKYRFTARVAPRIGKALALDDPEVRDAYRSLYGQPLDTVFAPRLAPRERLRWAWTALASRLESLPPFWTAYWLTLTETVGTDILALPIVVAVLGPLAGVVILVALGLLNVVTVGMMAEAVVRTGPMRYRNAYLGRLFESNLGGRGSLFATGLLAAFGFIWIPICYVGIGRTLESATSVPAAVWVAALFVATLAYLRRGSLDATIATVLAVGAVNLLLIVGLSVLALTHVHGSNLLHSEIPFVHGRPFEASAVGLVFGVVLMGYFGHLSSTTCSSLVLERDPSGRSLMRGCAGAQVTAIAVYCLFVVAMNGAIGPHGLTGTDGTVISPLVDVAGPGVAVLGSVFVILALGVGSVMEGLSLSWLVRERLPSTGPRVVVLPRRRAQLVFRGRHGLRVGLTYLGAGANGSRFAVDLERQGRLEHSEVAVSTAHDVLPAGDAGRHRLLLEVVEADGLRARVAVTSTLRMGYEGELDAAGLDLAEALRLSDEEAALVASLARSGEASPAEIAGSMGKGDEEAVSMLEALVARGVVGERSTPAGPVFSARMAPRRPRSSSVWDAIADDGDRVGPGSVSTPSAQRREPLARLRGLVLGRSGRFLVSVLPLTAAFVLGEWFVISGAGSFSELLSVLGVVIVSLFAGLYPVLLLYSSRRKGEYIPEPVHRSLGRPVLLGAIYLFFLAVLIAHGTVIWSDPAERVGAFAAALMMVALPVILARGGAFARRLTIEVRDDRRAGDARFAVLSGERPASATVRLDYRGNEQQPEGLTGEIPALGELRRAVFDLRRDLKPPPDEAKVWVHRVTEAGETESLPATARFRSGGRAHAVHLALSGGEAVVPFEDTELEVEIALREFGRGG